MIPCICTVATRSAFVKVSKLVFENEFDVSVQPGVGKLLRKYANTVCGSPDTLKLIRPIHVLAALMTSVSCCLIKAPGGKVTSPGNCLAAASVTVLSFPAAVLPMLAQATEVRAASSTSRYLMVVMVFV